MRCDVHPLPIPDKWEIIGMCKLLFGDTWIYWNDVQSVCVCSSIDTGRIKLTISLKEVNLSI